MTEQYSPILMSLSNAVTKVTHRVEALEASDEQQRLAALDWGSIMDRHDRWIRDYNKRITALEAASNDRQQDEDAECAAAPASTGSLVDRVVGIMADDDDRDLYLDDARAAIRSRHPFPLHTTPMADPTCPPPAPVPESVADALIKAECALSDIAEGEPMANEVIHCNGPNVAAQTPWPSFVRG